MDDLALGRALRAARIRLNLRQADVAEIIGVGQNTVSRVERGGGGSMSLECLRLLGSAVQVSISVDARWRGAELDRLLGSKHSALHDAVAGRFETLADWLTLPEVTFSVYGERGVIDVLAWHAKSRTLLVIELKTEIVDVQELLGTLDRKRRLAPRIAAERGWDPVTIAVWVILSDHRTNRRRVDAHRHVLRAALPADGRTMNSWLLDPRGSVAALSFWPVSDGASGKRRLATVRRVRARRGAASRA